MDLRGQPLNLDITFSCGQAFRWHKTSNGIWQGVVQNKLLEFMTDGNRLLWRMLPNNDEYLVRDYLRLEDDVNAIYARLSGADPHLAGLVVRFSGLRLLRQDPTETLFSFICSAANSIPRISAAIEALASRYGEFICERGDVCYYAFPSVEKLAGADPSELSIMKPLSFRGKTLQQVAEELVSRGANWLISLRGKSYEEARKELLSIPGVGRKIADCVCLFSLDKDQAVPVDTHIRRLALRLWGAEFEGKSLTDRLYDRIVNGFTKRYGNLAGWAQQFLFYEDLLLDRKA